MHRKDEFSYFGELIVLQKMTRIKIFGKESRVN